MNIREKIKQKYQKIDPDLVSRKSPYLYGRSNVMISMKIEDHLMYHHLRETLKNENKSLALFFSEAIQRYLEEREEI